MPREGRRNAVQLRERIPRRLRGARPRICDSPATSRYSDIERTRTISAREMQSVNQSDLPMALRSAYLALHRRTEKQFAPLGVTADQFVLLATLARCHALAQRELARRMPSDPSTVRAMLVLLEKQGLVKRTAHPTDARAKTVFAHRRVTSISEALDRGGAHPGANVRSVEAQRGENAGQTAHARC